MVIDFRMVIDRSRPPKILLTRRHIHRPAARGARSAKAHHRRLICRTGAVAPEVVVDHLAGACRGESPIWLDEGIDLKSC